MKQIITIGAALLLLNAGSAQAQNSIEQVLRNIETNNKELQANKQLIQSQKLEARTDNNLPDPTLSYAHLWARKIKVKQSVSWWFRRASTSPAYTPRATS
ncbi:hypothetical protein BFINE_56600 [Bacteroides finegoldii DSM 17565]|nr:hypothetical protein BFINE_56600 [Bacteroides finegoldii DSM 17565]